MNLLTLEHNVMTLFQEDTTGHDANHIRRVLNNAKQLIEREAIVDEAIIDVIYAAVLLHDVIDEKLTDNVAARQVLVKNWLIECGATEDQLNEIIYIIDNQSYSKNIETKKKLSMAGQIVQDADRLDAIGAIGIARTFYYGGSKGHTLYSQDRPIEIADMTQASYRQSTNVLNHFYEKLFLLKDAMNTESAKQLAISRTEFMQDFVARFHFEIEGKA